MTFTGNNLVSRMRSPWHSLSQDQYLGHKHHLSQDQIHWSQEPTYPRSISWSQKLPQSRSDSLGVGTYISKINIVVVDMTSVKIKSIGRRNLRIQDQDPGHRHFLCQDQVLWSQTTPLSKSRLISLLVTSIIKNHFKVHQLPVRSSIVIFS